MWSACASSAFPQQNTCFPCSFSCTLEYLRWKSCKWPNFPQCRVLLFSLGLLVVRLIDFHACCNSWYFCQLLLLKPFLLPVLLTNVHTDFWFSSISCLSRKTGEFYSYGYYFGCFFNPSRLFYAMPLLLDLYVRFLFLLADFTIKMLWVFSPTPSLFSPLFLTL